ncbi:hypothetical protein BZG36_02946 [Bifiguratus adelaidae]|uniref:Uncharacterized protein n=1 Tax=Bifiguratus adelaidae TaxID=1938954 RepID=A0A261Y013_9FUNG|nr:hypothetical protein BZG36_02946 [Bifiguratus adelaidae]
MDFAKKQFQKALVGQVAERVGDKYVRPGTEQQAYQIEERDKKRHWWQRKKEEDIGLTPFEAKVLRKVKRRAHFLDRGFRLCCCNIGFDALVGLIPVVGDFIGVFFALEVVRMCSQVGLPKSVVSKMFANVGLIPIVGDIADIFYKCNTRNAVLLEEYLMTRHRDEILMKQGKLPPSHVPGTGPIPGTMVTDENGNTRAEYPSAHSGPPRITARTNTNPPRIFRQGEPGYDDTDAEIISPTSGTSSALAPALPPRERRSNSWFARNPPPIDVPGQTYVVDGSRPGFDNPPSTKK